MSLQGEAGAKGPEVRGTDSIQGHNVQKVPRHLLGHKPDAWLCPKGSMRVYEKRVGSRPSARNLGGASGFLSAR